MLRMIKNTIKSGASDKNTAEYRYAAFVQTCTFMHESFTVLNIIAHHHKYIYIYNLNKFLQQGLFPYFEIGHFPHHRV